MTMFFSTAPAPQPASMISGGVRRPSLAGSFYPAEAGALREMVAQSLQGAPESSIQPKALIAPHAGYIYSGPIAGAAYRSIAGLADRIRRVILLGPPHRVPVREFCIPRARAFATPLGEVRLDLDALTALARLPGVEVDDAPHLQEHCLETQLPFLQSVLDDFTVVPILVGAVSPERVDALLRTLWGGDETLVVISSDLSHYNDYERTRTLDEGTRRAIETLRGDQLGEEQACGRHALRGLLSRAAALDLRVTTLDLRNSGDTAGRAQRDRVVGYGSWALEYATQARLAERDRQQLANVARKSIAIHLRQGRPPRVDLQGFSRPLQAIRASFVTLTLDGQLRGCIGSILPQQPLVTDVAMNACKAAFQDPRFRPLSQAEAARLEVSVSILSHPRPIAVQSEGALVEALHPEEDGVILEAKGPDGQTRRGLFLPHVWEQLRDPTQFVRHLKAKAGLNPNAWPSGARAWRFRTESFH
jgi:AmmeMemoRadiSam system protein B/AmmeMemoRadiSam system protein A